VAWAAQRRPRGLKNPVKGCLKRPAGTAEERLRAHGRANTSLTPVAAGLEGLA